MKKPGRRSWHLRCCLACLLSSKASSFQLGTGRRLSLRTPRGILAAPQQWTNNYGWTTGSRSSALRSAIKERRQTRTDGASLSPSSLPPTATRSTTRPSSPSTSQSQQIQLETLSRILVPSLLASLASALLFPPLALLLSYLISDAATFAVLSVDSSQFVQNFLTVTGLTFSILVGQTYYFMYQQQESVFNSLFGEVTEAKSLLEQVALVCQGRAEMYAVCLGAVKRYVEQDLKQGLGKEPAKILSARPMDDPLEIILYLTSVGIPSSIYDTVRSLRQARALRLAALQKKLPPVHLSLLWLLAAIELSSFPVLGAGTQSIGGYNILTIEGVLFGILTFGVTITLNVVEELYVGRGGAYNVDEVLATMVRGLDEELEGRMADMNVALLKDDDVDWSSSTTGAGVMGELPSPFPKQSYSYFESSSS